MAVGTTFNLPNYAGELFTASPKKTPFLSMIGGLSGGKTSDSFEFAVGQDYSLPTAGQPEISENASLTAPAPSHIAREQKDNTCQIFHESIDLSYAKLSQGGRLSGLNIAGQTANPKSEEDWQIEQKLIKMANDVEYTFINGVYQKATSADVAPKTRGMFELCKDVTNVKAEGAELSKALLDAFYLELVQNGAAWDNMTMFVGATLKQQVTNIYADQFNAQMNMGEKKAGMNVVTIETDFGLINIVLDTYVPNGSILVADIAHIAPVFCPVPGKGVLFVEELAKTGADNKKQLYGQIGLDHGMAYMHGTITGLK